MSIFNKRLSFLLCYLFINLLQASDQLPSGVSEEVKISSSSNIQPRYLLNDALEAFENNELDKAATIFTVLSKVGAFLPIRYLQHMKKDPFMPVEPVPQSALKLSQDFLDASLAYVKYKKDKNKKALSLLGTYILNDNAHALSLMRKLYKTDQNVLKELATNKQFKKIKSLTDLSKNRNFTCNGSILFWNCLDMDNLFAFYKHPQEPTFTKILKEFEIDYKQNPQSIGQIALKHAFRCEQNFWSHLAIENGEPSGLFKLLHDYTNILFEISENENHGLLSARQMLRDFSIYYISQIEKIGLLGDTSYSFSLGSLAYYLNEQEKNFPGARKYFMMSADLGYLPAQSRCASAFLTGIWGEKNLFLKRKYSKMGADQGDTNCQYSYAYALFNGDGGDKNLAESFRYFKMVADQEGATQNLEVKISAQYHCGLMIFESRQDLTKSLEYFIKAADQGHADAQEYCFSMFYQGSGCVQNYPEALKYIKMAADNGRAEAQTYYAKMRYDGLGDSIDLNEVLKYLKMAQEKGNAFAVTLLHKLENEVVQYLTSTTFNQVSEIPADENEEMTITLPALDEDLSDDEEKILPSSSTSPNTAALDAITLVQSTVPTLEDLEERQQQEEIARLTQENDQRISALRAKKRAQKGEAEHTLTLKKRDYIQTCKPPQMALPHIKEQQIEVDFETYEFVKTIFGKKGSRKINTYSNTAAQKAFYNLGCTVESKSAGSGENSTYLSFSLPEGRIMKIKYHNPHGYGDDNLYDDMKPYLKRYLNSINRTLDTLQVRN